MRQKQIPSYFVILFFFIALVMVLMLSLFFRDSGQVLTIGSGISHGERLDASRIRIIECRIWRRDYKKFVLGYLFPQQHSPSPGNTWGSAFIYVIDDDNVKFSWNIYSSRTNNTITLNDATNYLTIHLDASSVNVVFYTDSDGRLRKYTPTSQDTKMDVFFNRAIASLQAELTKDEFLEIWELLQTKNAESDIIFPSL